LFLLDQLRVPRGGHSQGIRKYCLIALNDVEPDQQRNTQTRLLDCDPLESVDVLRVEDPENRPDPTFSDTLVGRRRALKWNSRRLIQLADLLL